MRVLHVIDSLGIGGTELGLANVIERTGHDIAHAVCALRALGATADRLAARGVPITVLHKQPGNRHLRCESLFSIMTEAT